MKRFFLTILSLAGTGTIFAQNITDALRYSTEDLNGTARYKAMSGAFGALGGDFSAININPAGGAVFSGSEIGFTIGNDKVKNKNTFLNSTSTQKSSDFAFNQFGVVFSIPNYNNDSKWKKFALALNYQTTRNFNGKDIYYAGNSSGNNLGDYFLYYANGIQQQDLMLNEYVNKQVVYTATLTELYDRMANATRPFNFRNALLGYTTRLIDPTSGKRDISTSDSDTVADATLQESTYVNNVSGKETRQIFDISTQGNVKKYNINFATQYGDNLYMGVNLNPHQVDYLSITRHSEVYSNSTNIQNAFFRNEVKTTGSGFSFQLGAIAKLTENMRLGVSYASPTWYTLQDETAQYLETNNGTYYADPRIIVVYDEYKFRTPGAWTGSFAYIFGKNGIVSLDYVYKGYNNITFKTESLRGENDIIQNELRGTSSLRLGGEYRIKALSLRAGWRYEQSPYKTTNKYVGDLIGYSLGAGYSFGSIRLDISYDTAKQDNLFQAYESVLTTPAKISSTRSNLLFTLSAKLF
ncbi:MAG: outer membrane protein transport protein [Capnocytophaga sp.]|nr:outer membrane protein transport protein [Capnocytophaga sp.]